MVGGKLKAADLARMDTMSSINTTDTITVFDGDKLVRATPIVTLAGAGVTSSAAELNLLDGSSSTSPAVSTAAILDSGGDLRNGSNNGTVGSNVSAIEYGDGFNHTTVLTLSSVIGAIGDNVSLAIGELIYTFPAGSLTIISSYMSVGITLNGGTPTTDTPDVGLGTVIGSGAVALLSGTATFEDIITGQTAADVAGTATVIETEPTAAAPFQIATGDAHTLHFNYADAWADVTAAAASISGTVVIHWKFNA